MIERRCPSNEAAGVHFVVARGAARWRFPTEIAVLSNTYYSCYLDACLCPFGAHDYYLRFLRPVVVGSSASSAAREYEDDGGGEGDASDGDARDLAIGQVVRGFRIARALGADARIFNVERGGAVEHVRGRGDLIDVPSGDVSRE